MWVVPPRASTHTACHVSDSRPPRPVCSYSTLAATSAAPVSLSWCSGEHSPHVRRHRLPPPAAPAPSPALPAATCHGVAAATIARPVACHGPVTRPRVPLQPWPRGRAHQPRPRHSRGHSQEASSTGRSSGCGPASQRQWKRKGQAKCPVWWAWTLPFATRFPTKTAVSLLGSC